MDGLRLFLKLTGAMMDRLRRRWKLPAGLVLLCVLLPALAGRAAESFWSRGVPFGHITLAVAAPEGDRTPELLERYLGGMEDIGQFCRIRAMGRPEALDALAEGRVTAVLELPEGFVRGVQNGENPAVRLIVDGGRPLESLLTLWVGQSASDLLTAVQSGIYAVLDRYDRAPPEGLSRDQAVLEINLAYVRWTLGRRSLFREEALLPTLALPTGVHYTLCLLWFLLFSMAPAFAWCFQGRSWLRRLRYAGRGPLYGFAAGWAACCGTMAPVIGAALVLTARLPLPAAAGAAVAAAPLFASWAALCGSAASGSTLSFAAGAAWLLLAGGVVPPVLLPEAVRRWEALSPIAWLRSLAAEGLGYPASYPAALPLLASAAGAALAAALYCRRREGAGA